jgi:hypothetical protein
VSEFELVPEVELEFELVNDVVNPVCIRLVTPSTPIDDDLNVNVVALVPFQLYLLSLDVIAKLGVSRD